MCITTVESEEKAAEEDDASDHEVTMSIAVKHEHYRLGDEPTWWERITKGKAKELRKESEEAIIVVQAMYGDNSLGWFVPVALWAGPPKKTT